MMTLPSANRPPKSLMPPIHLRWFASAEDEGRTEDPSDLKLRKAREEGRITKSQELTGGLVLLLPVLTLILLAPWLLRGCVSRSSGSTWSAAPQPPLQTGN